MTRKLVMLVSFWSSDNGGNDIHNAACSTSPAGGGAALRCDPDTGSCTRVSCSHKLSPFNSTLWFIWFVLEQGLLRVNLDLFHAIGLRNICYTNSFVRLFTESIETVSFRWLSGNYFDSIILNNTTLTIIVINCFGFAKILITVFWRTITFSIVFTTSKISISHWRMCVFMCMYARVFVPHLSFTFKKR